MRPAPLAYMVVAAALLGACERYTEQTSPCFGRGGTAKVARAALSAASPVEHNSIAAKDCAFEDLPSPE